MRVFWWNTVPNLGDQLTPLLLERYGRKPEWASPEGAEFAGIGSILEHFHGRPVTLWGTGRAGRSPTMDLAKAHVLALRGKDTLALVEGAKVDVLGDPGLLAPDLVPPRPGGDYVAIVPHWQDQDRMRKTYPAATFVDVTGDPIAALETIASAKQVISSSLHGLVIADAYYVPRMWDWFGGVQGGGFKFYDYGTVVGQAEPGRWFKPSPRLIALVKKELKEVLDGA